MNRMLRKGWATSRFRSKGLVPAAILAASLVAATAVLLNHLRAAAQLSERILEENRLRMHSTREHVEDYFDGVYSTLLFISLDEDVKAMRRASQEFIQRLYDHQWNLNRLAEVYVIERDFTGTRKPFQTFERASEGESVEETHALDREQEEYETQRAQIRRFLTNASLPALISSEVALCVNDPAGKIARGLVYSVPIRTSNGLAGIVAGMIPTHVLQTFLERDQQHQVVLLINSRGDLYGGGVGSGPIRRWFQEHLAQGEASRFIGQRPETFEVGRWTALWTPVKIISEDQWWLVYLHDKKAYQGRDFLAGTLGPAALAGALILAGVALALLSHTTAKRLEEQVRHLHERAHLERQVQAASEREQRRIGNNLHEDHCQRLSGIALASKALQESLETQAPSEAGMARGIMSEIQESLANAKQLADELQPVPLLGQGLPVAIERLAFHTQHRSHIRCRFVAKDLPDIEDAGVATHLYRIAQEALNNAVQHAQAGQIDIFLSSDGRQILLTIADDGSGMREGAAQGSSVGIRIMHHRADLIGARLEIESAPGTGTVVTCWCPVPKSDYATPGVTED